MAGTFVRVPLPDSGWILPTLETDVTVGGTHGHWGLRKVGNIVYGIINIAIANPAANKLVMTFPAGYRIGLPPAGGEGSGALVATGLRLLTSGACRTNGAASTIVVSFSYPVG